MLERCEIESLDDFYTWLTMVNLRQQELAKSRHANLEDRQCESSFYAGEAKVSFVNVAFDQVPNECAGE